MNAGNGGRGEEYGEEGYGLQVTGYEEEANRPAQSTRIRIGIDRQPVTRDLLPFGFAKMRESVQQMLER